jgi:hypothetical protein
MKIRLDEQYFIEDSGSGYSLVKWSGQYDKKGYPLYDMIKYPSNLENAIKLYARFKAIDEREEMTLKEYTEHMNTTFLLILRAIQGDKV